MQDCVFCRIVRNEIPAERVYEDDHALAMLDIHPRSPGHTMVIPKRHAETILDLSDADVGSIWAAVKRVAGNIKEALAPDGFTIGINHGRVSGQAVDHLHVHVIPRWAGDGGHSIHSVVENPPRESLAVLAQKIRNAA